MTVVLSIALAYLIGSIPVGFLFAKAKGVDIRTQGSGNIGATNVSRVLGPKLGVLVFLLDTLKGALLPALIQLLHVPGAWGISNFDMAAAAGIAAVAGHMLTPWLGFKGGKGIASGLGALLGTAPLVGLGGFMIWLGVMFMTHYVSLSSVIAVLGVWGCSFLLQESPFFIGVYFVLGVYVWIKHIPNMKRLMKGEEPKFALQGRSSDAGPASPPSGREAPGQTPSSPEHQARSKTP